MGNQVTHISHAGRVADLVRILGAWRDSHILYIIHACWQLVVVLGRSGVVHRRCFELRDDNFMDSSLQHQPIKCLFKVMSLISTLVPTSLGTIPGAWRDDYMYLRYVQCTDLIPPNVTTQHWTLLAMSYLLPLLSAPNS